MPRVRIPALVTICCVVSLGAQPILAQDPARVRLDLERADLAGTVPLSLEETVRIAMERNPALFVERLRVEQAEVGIDEATGAWEPVFDASGQVARRDNVVASRFFPTGVYVEEDSIYQARLNGLTKVGSTYGVDLRYQRQISNSNTQSLSPQFSANLNFTYSQPLMRDFGSDVTETPLRIAQREHEMSEANLSLTLSTMVFDVVQAYWNLVFVREDLEVKRQSLTFAEQLLEQNETLFDAGEVAAVNVHEARAAMFERQEQVIVAESLVGEADDRLKVLMYADLDNVNVIPRDELADGGMVVDLPASYSSAMAGRPEVVRLEREIEQRIHETDFASNQAKPRLDLNLQYGLSGLSGLPNTTLVNPESPTLGTAGDTVAGSVFAGITRPLGAFDRFFKGDGFDSWSVELRFEMPLWNTSAKARVSNAQLRQQESEVNLTQTREAIRLQIRDAARGVDTARQSVAAARAAIAAVDEQLSAARLRFDAGLASSYELLLVQDDLANAMTRELQALMTHNVAEAALLLADSRILPEYGIEVQ